MVGAMCQSANTALFTSRGGRPQPVEEQGETEAAEQHLLERHGAEGDAHEHRERPGSGREIGPLIAEQSLHERNVVGERGGEEQHEPNQDDRADPRGETAAGGVPAHAQCTRS